jgi:hypothetical protein
MSPCYCSAADCHFCHTNYNVSYCGMCGHWFCPPCGRRYDKRIAAMAREKGGDLIDAIAGFFGLK